MVLFIDATNRLESRTLKLANYLINKLDDKEVKHINLYDIDIPTFDSKLSEVRTRFNNMGFYDHKMYDLAKDFIKADLIVIAAPYYDLSFPAILKKYIEAVSVVGLTYSYNQDGIPIGLAKANTLYYITTSGGKVLDDSFGFGYIDSLCTVLFGIKRCVYYKAECLDLFGANVEEILDKVKKQIEEEL